MCVFCQCHLYFYLLTYICISCVWSVPVTPKKHYYWLHISLLFALFNCVLYPRLCKTRLIDTVMTGLYYAVLCISPPVLWHCWLGVGKSIWPVQIEWLGVGVVMHLERGAVCLCMVQLMPLHPKTPPSFASFKSRLVLPSWYWLTQVVLEQRPLLGVVVVVFSDTVPFVIHVCA